MNKLGIKSIVFTMLILMLIVSGCSQNASPATTTTTNNGGGNTEGADTAGNTGTGSDAGVKLTVATVNNPDMIIMQNLTEKFEQDTGIEVEYVVLPENDLRKKVTEDVALGAGQFDVVTISNYDTPIWAANGWIESLQPHLDGMSEEQKAAYDYEDIFPMIREALSYEGEQYALPFYAESSILYYNKEMLANAGVTLSETPTWQEVADAAKKAQEANDVPGIVLRGLPGWGEVLAPLNTVINAFGGRWYDMEWNAQLTSPETIEAVQFYVDLLNEAGQSGATNTGFTEALTLMSTEKAAMWYDASVAAGFLNDESSSQVAGKIGYTLAPSAKRGNTGWLYSWCLAIESASQNKEAAAKFIEWATSKEYIELVGESQGWGVVPSGTRTSTYENPKYQEAAPFSEIVLKAMEAADYESPTVDPVPYKGIQFVAIPEFQQLGTEVSQDIAAAIAGQVSVQEAMENAQLKAEQVAIDGGYKQ